MSYQPGDGRWPLHLPQGLCGYVWVIITSEGGGGRKYSDTELISNHMGERGLLAHDHIEIHL